MIYPASNDKTPGDCYTLQSPKSGLLSVQFSLIFAAIPALIGVNEYYRYGWSGGVALCVFLWAALMMIYVYALLGTVFHRVEMSSSNIIIYTVFSVQVIQACDVSVVSVDPLQRRKSAYERVLVIRTSDREYEVSPWLVDRSKQCTIADAIQRCLPYETWKDIKRTLDDYSKGRYWRIILFGDK